MEMSYLTQLLLAYDRAKHSGLNATASAFWKLIIQEIGVTK